MSDYPKVEVPERCCKSANKDVEKIKECIRQIRWSDAEFQYDEVIAIAERMAAEIERLKTPPCIVADNICPISTMSLEISALKCETALAEKPEIVFCKDCRSMQKGDQLDPDRMTCVHGAIVEPDDFCSHGQRKSEEGK